MRSGCKDRLESDHKRALMPGIWTLSLVSGKPVQIFEQKFTIRVMFYDTTTNLVKWGEKKPYTQNLKEKGSCPKSARIWKKLRNQTPEYFCNQYSFIAHEITTEIFTYNLYKINKPCGLLSNLQIKSDSCNHSAFLLSFPLSALTKLRVLHGEKYQAPSGRLGLSNNSDATCPSSKIMPEAGLPTNK